MLVRIWERGRGPGPFTLWVGMYIGGATMEISMEGPQKMKNRTIICSSYNSLGYIHDGM
jgi:hypothetical protein